MRTHFGIRALIITIAAAALTVLFSPSATADEGTKTIAWILPDGGTPDRVTWPQPIASEANLTLIPCGTTVTLQVDTYPYLTPEDIARTDALTADGILEHGEDHGWVISWTWGSFTAPDCAPEPEPTIEPVPEPTVEPAPEPVVEAPVPPAQTVEAAPAPITPPTDVLAETGPDARQILGLSALGVGLLGTGWALIATRKGRRS